MWHNHKTHNMKAKSAETPAHTHTHTHQSRWWWLNPSLTSLAGSGCGLHWLSKHTTAPIHSWHPAPFLTHSISLSPAHSIQLVKFPNIRKVKDFSVSLDRIFCTYFFIFSLLFCCSLCGPQFAAGRSSESLFIWRFSPLVNATAQFNKWRCRSSCRCWCVSSWSCVWEISPWRKSSQPVSTDADETR